MADSQYFSLEEPPRSPKITYSTPSPTSTKMPSVTDNISSNVSPSSGYFEQRSPKFLSHQTSPKKFVFDAVSPRRETIGMFCANLIFHIKNNEKISPLCILSKRHDFCTWRAFSLEIKFEFSIIMYTM